MQIRAVCERGRRAHDRRHLFDFDLNPIGRIFGFFPRRRDHRSDRLADEAHDVARQHRLADRYVIELLQHRPDRLDGGEIGGGDDRRAFWWRNPYDSPRSDRASHEAYPVRRPQIGGETAVARDQRRVLEPPDRAADPAPTVVLGMTGHSVPCFAIAQRRRENTRRGFASAIASIPAADNPAERSSASGSMSAGGNE